MRDYLRLQKQNAKEIVFYSEGKSYWINFRDVVDSLVREYGRTVHYVTSSIDDPVLERGDELFRPYYIGSEIFRILLFQTLKAKVFLTTLPDIGTFHLKRPAGVEKLIYIHHTLGSMNMIFLPGALDSYDVIMCSSPHQIPETREMEAYYKTREKELIPAGYPPLDDLIARIEKQEEKQGNADRNAPPKTSPIATIAPSWQKDNILERVAEPLIDSLLAAGFTVRLRPHPRTLKLDMGRVEKIVAAYAGNNAFSLDNTPGSFTSYLDTDLLVTDWSGTGFKFSFALLRPVLFLNTPPKARNPEYAHFTNVPVEVAWRNVVGRDLNEAEIATAGVMAKELVADAEFSGRIKAFRKANVFNLGRGGKSIAESVVTYL